MARRGAVAPCAAPGACRLPLGRCEPGQRGRREEARERKPRRVSAPRRRRPPARAPSAAAPSRGRPPEPARGEAAAALWLRGPPAPPAYPGAGRCGSLGRGVGLRASIPRGPGADQVPEAD
ncbi:gap junction alpha-3 protein-like [Saccopteryx bilineata]|uniref:gap junction alpha-3 protein-like n=1 Tax=Saccopteryx bilineata TaxID=59482 RepID=UPI00338F3B86